MIKVAFLLLLVSAGVFLAQTAFFAALGSGFQNAANSCALFSILAGAAAAAAAIFGLLGVLDLLTAFGVYKKQGWGRTGAIFLGVLGIPITLLAAIPAFSTGITIPMCGINLVATLVKIGAILVLMRSEVKGVFEPPPPPAPALAPGQWPQQPHGQYPQQYPPPYYPPQQVPPQGPPPAPSPYPPGPPHQPQWPAPYPPSQSPPPGYPPQGGSPPPPYPGGPYPPAGVAAPQPYPGAPPAPGYPGPLPPGTPPR